MGDLKRIRDLTKTTASPDIAGYAPVDMADGTYRVALGDIVRQGVAPLVGDTIERRSFFADLAAAGAASIPADVSRIFVNERRGSFKRAAAQPAHGLKFQNGAQWWTIDEPIIDFTMAGGDTAAADNAAAVNRLGGLGRGVYVPAGRYASSKVGSQFDGPFFGEGQIGESNGKYRAPNFAAVKAAPTSNGATNIVDMFSGDISKVLYAAEYRITGAATLGQPTTGYQYTNGAVPFLTAVYSTSGWNEGTAGNTGRTGAVAYRTFVFQSGQGDLTAYNGSAFVSSTKAGSTHFLANPACGLFGGDLGAGADGVYLNAGEMVLQDNGYDAAGIGWVINLQRTNGTGAKDAYWAGFRAQSKGAVAPDDAFVAAGKWKRGLTLAYSDFGADQAAIVLKADQRVYFNAAGGDANSFHFSSLGSTYFAYSSALNGYTFVVANNSVLQMYSSLFYSPQVIRTGAHFILADGVAAPAATAGQAKLYVDSADGDLKVIFGDGTIKTIVVDT